MDKPTKKCSIYIEKPVGGLLVFWAPEQVAKRMQEFGGHLAKEHGRWFFYIDRRYDMQDIIAYLESLGVQKEEGC